MLASVLTSEARVFRVYQRMSRLQQRLVPRALSPRSEASGFNFKTQNNRVFSRILIIAFAARMDIKAHSVIEPQGWHVRSAHLQKHSLDAERAQFAECISQQSLRNTPPLKFRRNRQVPKLSLFANAMERCKPRKLCRSCVFLFSHQ